jgi:hypothetical protein
MRSLMAGGSGSIAVNQLPAAHAAIPETPSTTRLIGRDCFEKKPAPAVRLRLAQPFYG